MALMAPLQQSCSLVEAEETLRGASDGRSFANGGAVTVCRKNFRESGCLSESRLNAGVQRGFSDDLRVVAEAGGGLSQDYCGAGELFTSSASMVMDI